MIDQNTVLILGAGASKPFGYPLGFELKENILDVLNFSAYEYGEATRLINSLSHFEPIASKTTMLRYLVRNCDFTTDHIKKFSEYFRGSSRPSIDTFLENQNDFLKIGKILIAYAILQCEHANNLTHDKSNWYKYLSNEISSTSWEAISRNKLTVITYNYDRSFETFLANDFKYTYDRDIEDCYKKLEDTIPIIHVHGRVGCTSWKPYTSEVSPSNLEDATKELYIITEANEVKAYESVHKALSNATNIFIVGFSFDERNLQRLELLKYAQGANIYATRFRLTDLEVNTINKKIKNRIIFSRSETFDIVDFFRRDVSLAGVVSGETIAFNSTNRH